MCTIFHLPSTSKMQLHIRENAVSSPDRLKSAFSLISQLSYLFKFQNPLINSPFLGSKRPVKKRSTSGS